jgi:hypothetical protein
MQKSPEEQARQYNKHAQEFTELTAGDLNHVQGITWT